MRKEGRKMNKVIVQQKFPEKNKAVLVGLVSFLDLFSNARLSYHQEQGDAEYQRQIERDRVIAIAKYIIRCLASNQRGASNIVFPNSIILACDNENNDLSVVREGDVLDLWLTKGTMIVDGQHRFSGMKYLYEQASSSVSVFGYQSEAILNFIKNYKFNCTILLNYDMWEQAQVFANVNFNQKKVNKSLFYDIYGVQIPLDDSNTIPYQNEIYLAHELVVFLDNNSASVFQGFVKMLGKGAGYVSQAFLVECLVKHLSPKGIWSDAVEMLKKQDVRYNYIAHELSSYLAAVRFSFMELWPNSVDNKPKSLLCKTSGLGAILMLLKDLHITIPNDMLTELKESSSSPITYAKIITFFKTALEPLIPFGQELFGLGGSYSAGAGSGMQTKLYKRMKEILVIE